MSILSPATTASSANSPPQASPEFNANCQSIPSLPFPNNPHLSFLPLRSNPTSRRRILQATFSPQPPPLSDPPPENDPILPEGNFASFSGLQDRVQIFLAVLLWISLFFWSAACDGRNNGSGRPNKWSQFRR
ncbi:uncharacterized protein LOC110626095 [Manihot esculenta]|uniref:Uncharacterized protein n=1 Tax=Manihot esculenta TaxID=3983 RepID=A0A2C9UYG5_MANES|nr:uncharacterized protein LOC110626095 [Manihot esculenta]OAY36872.1 hypothetical protein MANES_11G056000v8 [Manihot esculenta]